MSHVSHDAKPSGGHDWTVLVVIDARREELRLPSAQRGEARIADLHTGRVVAGLDAGAQFEVPARREPHIEPGESKRLVVLGDDRVAVVREVEAMLQRADCRRTEHHRAAKRVAQLGADTTVRPERAIDAKLRSRRQHVEGEKSRCDLKRKFVAREVLSIEAEHEDRWGSASRDGTNQQDVGSRIVGHELPIDREIAIEATEVVDVSLQRADVERTTDEWGEAARIDRSSSLVAPRTSTAAINGMCVRRRAARAA